MLKFALLALALPLAVFDPAGRPVTGATLRPAGPWVLILHPQYAPALVPAAASRATLAPRSTLRTLPDCRRSLGPNQPSLGPPEGFRLPRPRGHNEPPLAGEHDLHWFLSSGPHRLLLSANAYLHPGFPEELLTAPEASVSGWRSGRLSGLDFTGRAPDGTYFRAITRDFDQSVSYSGVPLPVAREFDRILGNLCILP